MEAKIKWNEGDGYITATFKGSGNDSVLISSDINEDIDREQNITITTTNGTNPKEKSMLVKQLGLREPFEVTDGIFICSDGNQFNVLKQ